QYKAASDMVQNGQVPPKVEMRLSNDADIRMYRQQLNAMDMEIDSSGQENSKVANLQKRRDLLAKKLEDIVTETRNTATMMLLTELSQSGKQSTDALDVVTRRID